MKNNLIKELLLQEQPVLLTDNFYVTYWLVKNHVLYWGFQDMNWQKNTEDLEHALDNLSCWTLVDYFEGGETKKVGLWWL